jgi:hypothetical protein
MALAHERTIGSKGHGLFNMPGAQLPAYIQHVYNDMVEGGKKPGSLTYRLAIGIVQNWAEGHDGHGNKVSAKTQAKAVAAVAEWERLKAKAHARSAKNVTEATAEERDAAGRLAALLRDPATSPRTLDRAASAAALLAGGTPVAEAKFEKKGEKKAEKAEGGEKDSAGELDAEVARLKKKGMPHKLAYKAACKKLGVKEAANEPVSHSRLATRLVEGPVPYHGGPVQFESSKHPRSHGKFASKMGGKTSDAYGNVQHSRLAPRSAEPSLDSYIASNDPEPLDPSHDTVVGKQVKRHSRMFPRLFGRS